MEYAHADPYWHENIERIRGDIEKLQKELGYYLEMRSESHYKNIAVEVLNAETSDALTEATSKWDD